MRAILVHSFLVAGATVLVQPAARGDSWVGKEIILKQNGSRIGHTENGKQVYLARLNSLSYRVLEENDDWIRVRHDKHTGWFSKAEAVLVEEADVYFSNLLRSSPGNDQYYARRGWARNLRRDYDKAVADYTQALRLSPTEVDWLSNRGIIQRNAKNYDDAIRDFTRAIQLNPNSASLYHNRGRTYGLKKEYEKGIADCNKALTLDPESYLAYNQRGIVWNAADDYDRAIKDYDEVLRINPEYMWGWNNRAIARKNKGEFAAAIADFEKAIGLASEEGAPLANLAWLLATCSDPKFRNGKRAVELATKACEMGHYEDPEHLETLGAACAEAGRFEDAVNWQTKALADPVYIKDNAVDSAARLALYKEKKTYTVALKSARKLAIDAVQPAETANRPPVIEAGPLKGWRQYRFEEAGFSAAFPEKPASHKQTVNNGAAKIDNFAWSHEGVDMTFMVSYFDLPRNMVLGLDKATAAYAGGRGGKITSQKEITLGHMAGREAHVSISGDKVSRLRIFIVGPRWIQVIVEGSADNVDGERATAFLDSYRLEKK